VGIEQQNSAIPRYRMNAQIGYGFLTDFEFTWTVRYLSAVKESCANVSVTPVPGCATTGLRRFNTLRAMTYNDAQLQYTNAFTLKGLTSKRCEQSVRRQPAGCYTCTLTVTMQVRIDLPGAFWNVRARYSSDSDCQRRPAGFSRLGGVFLWGLVRRPAPVHSVAAIPFPPSRPFSKSSRASPRAASMFPPCSALQKRSYPSIATAPTQLLSLS